MGHLENIISPSSERASPHKMVKCALSSLGLKLIQNVDLDVKPSQKKC